MLFFDPDWPEDWLHHGPAFAIAWLGIATEERKLRRRSIAASPITGLRARPADVYVGRGQTILLQRERIKRQTIAQRRLQHRRQAA